MRTFGLLIFLLTSSIFPHATAVAQGIPDISGSWNGTVQVPFGNDWTGEYEFEQKGMLVDGYASIWSPTRKDSSRSIFSGSVKDGIVRITGTKYIYRTTGCLSVMELTYSQKEGRDYLTGRWKGDWAVSTCAPGVSGKLELTRVTSSSQLPPLAAKEESNRTIPNEEATALMTALQKRNYYALIIGINDYKDERIVDLENPVPDAKELRDVLLKHYDFKDENTQLLSNPTRSMIIDSFDALSQKAGERDQVLIFYAGHGLWDERLSQGFWLPADASINSKAQWLSNSTIRDYISGIRAKHILLITDACFSGSIFRERAVNTNSKAILEMYKLPSRKAMTSGALKTVPDKSVFISYLIKSLINNEQPFLSSEELFQSFKIAVINNSANGQVPQYGPIGQVGDEGGDFIFLRQPDN